MTWKKNLSKSTLRQIERIEQDLLFRHFVEKHINLALELGRWDFHVFPIWNAHTPAFQDFDYRASKFGSDIKKMWRKYPGAIPGVSLTKSRFLVVEAPSLRHLNDFLFPLNAPIDERRSLIVETPTGNVQRYFYISEARPLLASSNDLVASEIRIRCMNEFVPGPEFYRPDNRQYKIVSGHIVWREGMPPILYNYISAQNEKAQIEAFGRLDKLKGA